MSGVSQRERTSGEMGARVVTGVLFAASFLAALLAGGGWFWGYVFVLLGLVGWEYARLVRLSRGMTGVWIASLLGMFLTFFFTKEIVVLWLFVQIAVLVQGVWFLFHWPEEPFERLAKSVFGLVYFGFPLVWLMDLTVDSPAPLLGFFALLWAADVGAYGVGRWKGRHPLAPKISPRKTVEGFVGRLLAPMIVAPILMGVLDWGWMTWVAALGVGLGSEVGDLLESTWKRERGVKNSSSLLPGHGGILDRLDSLFVALPVFWLIWRYGLH